MNVSNASDLSTNPAAGPKSQRVGAWRRPDWLRIDLRTELHSDVYSQMEEYGWQTWRGTVVGIWTLSDLLDFDDPDQAEIASVPHQGDRGWDGVRAEVEEEQVGIALGRIKVYSIRFGDQPRPPGAEGVTGGDLFEAADAISATLANTICPLLDLESGDLFISEVLEAIDGEYVDELLVMDETELDPRFRGSGIGAWADARVISALAPDQETLIVAKAAPLRRDDFLPPADRESRREFTPEETVAWAAAQDRLWQHWERHLGLTRIESHRGLLVGLGGAHPTRESTLARWQR